MASVIEAYTDARELLSSGFVDELMKAFATFAETYEERERKFATFRPTKKEDSRLEFDVVIVLESFFDWEPLEYTMTDNARLPPEINEMSRQVKTLVEELYKVIESVDGLEFDPVDSKTEAFLERIYVTSLATAFGT